MSSETPSINYVSLSKAMSKALRHRPERIGITLHPPAASSCLCFAPHSTRVADGHAR
jgi:hypothetical protein